MSDTLEFRSEDEKIGDAAREISSSVARGAVGALPVVGPIAAELITHVIGDKRIARVEDAILKLSVLVADGMSERGLQRPMNDQDADVIDRVLTSSLRQRHEDRRLQIAHIAAEGILQTEYDVTLGLIDLQDSLDQVDVALLMVKCSTGEHHQKLLERNKDVVREAAVSINRNLISAGLPAPYMALHLSKLSSLGLLERKFRKLQMRRNMSPTSKSFGQAQVPEDIHRYLEEVHEMDVENFAPTFLGEILCSRLDPANADSYLDEHRQGYLAAAGSQ